MGVNIVVCIVSPILLLIYQPRTSIVLILFRLATIHHPSGINATASISIRKSGWAKPATISTETAGGLVK